MQHTLLIIKANSVLADHLSRIFAEAGHRAIVINTNYDEVIQAVHNYSPTVLLIEATFADNQGFELVRQAKQFSPALRCIVCMPDTPIYYAKAVQIDVNGYLPTGPDDPWEMLNCLDQISQGYRYISQSFRAAFTLPSNQHKPLIDTLSERQKQILKLIAHGYTSRQIALELSLAEPTVRHHKEQIAHTLGLPGVYMLKLFVGSVTHLL